jgi:hypothetical protein
MGRRRAGITTGLIGILLVLYAEGPIWHFVLVGSHAADFYYSTAAHYVWCGMMGWPRQAVGYATVQCHPFSITRGG